jgi:cytochrome P450
MLFHLATLTKVKRNDLIDLMLDAVKHELDSEEDEDADSRLNYKSSSKSKLDEIVVVASAMVMLFAGYDTTAISMAVCAWQLALNPEIQRRLQGGGAALIEIKLESIATSK